MNFSFKIPPDLNSPNDYYGEKGWEGGGECLKRTYIYEASLGGFFILVLDLLM